MALLVALAVWLVATRWSAMADLVADARPGPLFVVLAGSCLLLVPNSLFWSLTLRSLGEDVATGTVLNASARTLLARYLPGGVWYAAGRSVLLAGRGVRPSALVAVSGMELGLGPPAGLVIGALLLAGSTDMPAWLPWSGGALLLAAVLVGRPILNRVLAWWARRRSHAPPGPLTTRTLAGLLGVMTTYWLLMGTLFWAYLQAMGASPLHGSGGHADLEWAEASGAFLVSWGVGFYALFAPQGVGVSEVGFLTIVGWGTDAVLLVAGFRLLLLARDLVLTGVGEALARRSDR
jgi:hypothetical protein